MDNRYTPTVCPNCGVVLPAQKINMCATIAETVRKRPDLTYREIGAVYGLNERTVKRYSRRAGIRRKRGVKPGLITPPAQASDRALLG